jgi:hypothetical protein
MRRTGPERGLGWPFGRSSGDIWIAKSGGYPVRWKVTATGGVAGPGSGGYAGFEYVLDITNANDPANVIAVPTT